MFSPLSDARIGTHSQISLSPSERVTGTATSGAESLRLNREPCTEKIRSVAAFVLEVLAEGIVDAGLLERAIKFRDLYPHLLAILESRASDEPGPAKDGGFGEEPCPGG